jgi:lysyl-tRNA synthetase class 2
MMRARQLRRDQTDAERKLWSRLRSAQLGVKFRRQHPVAGYYADFCCVEQQLIVELDGGQHADRQTYDKQRTADLRKAGFRVVRFWNDDALIRTDDVLEAIVRALGEERPPHPNPLPRLRRRRGSQEPSIPSEPGIAPEPGIPPESGAMALLGAQSSHEPQPTNSLSPGAAGGEGWGEGALLRSLQLRASLYQLIRRFFSDRHVLEVETPILSAAGNTEPNIESFTTAFSGHVDAGARERWLRTSPEYPLKRLLAAGVGDCYELGRVFRNGEAGGRHNPEFTMLEWYRVGWDHHRLMRETIDLVQAALAMAGRRAELAVTTYRQLFQDQLDIDPVHATIDALRAPLAEYGIDPEGLVRDDWLDLLITHRLQPAFPRDRITVIHDYPATQCALARIRPGEPPLAERFELYLGRYELANGYHELNDAAEQRGRFERDNVRRRERGLREVPLDENLLAVLDALPDCAGVALGVERLLMCLAGTDVIADVLAFPFSAA